MNAVQILLKDHKQIKATFSQFESAGDRANQRKQIIVEKAIDELQAHCRLEERIFYPAVLARCSKETQDKIQMALHDHRVADFLMECLKETEPEEETFDGQFKLLIETVRDHLREEEHRVFPRAMEILGEDLGPLGVEMEDFKERHANGEVSCATHQRAQAAQATAIMGWR